MKKNILYIIIVFLSLNSFAQTPASPELCLITVGNDSLVHLKWYYGDTSQIDGFIIKRVIYDGIGVVNGTLNNIEVINDNSISAYIDTSLEYSTHAKPYIRAEEYAVNSYVTRNDSIIFSNMTLGQNTIFLTSEWNMCSTEAYFSWNEYKNRTVLKYQLLYKTESTEYELLTELPSNQTSFSTSNLETNNKYYFKVLAILDNENNCLADTSVSIVSNFFTFVPEIPEDVMLFNVTTLNNNSLKLNFNCEKTDGLKNYSVFRNNIEIFSFDVNNIINSYIDEIDVSVVYEYYFSAIDSCDRELKRSNSVKNIVLDANLNDREFELSWTNTTIFDENIDYFEIMTNIGDGWVNLKNENNNSFSTNITLFDVFGSNNNQNTTSVSFQIIAHPKSSFNDSLLSYSNIVNIDLNGILAIPNAFNPNSNNPENRFFTIKALFISSFNITIFSKSGSLLFESDDINNSWNGKDKRGNLLPKDTYIYYIEYTSTNGNVQKINGVVNLVY
ncbi:MAG: gliding motility-associated C-terminal domain-containing protein [Bacteroidales bacterium]|nr:gliding motility-associated C-terminal domain-containing protein [Bacteroidales bacterium]